MRNSTLRQLGTKLGSKALLSAERYFLSKKTAADAEEAGARLARRLYPFFGKQRKRALANFALVMPELSEAERESMALRVFEHFGRVAGDFFYTSRRTNQDVLDSMETVGWEFGQEALAYEKGIIAATAHFGNWERFGHWFCATGGKITVVSRAANDQGLEQRVQAIREKTGMRILTRGKSTKTLVEILKRREIIGLLPDQNSGESFLPFFGKPAGTVLGPAKLHKLTGAPILPAFCVRIGPAKFRMILKPHIMAPDASLEEIMARINLAIEEVVREYPDQWLWIHDRWRSAREEGLL